MWRGIALAAVVVIAAACSLWPAPDNSDGTGQPILVEGRDADVVLSMRIASDVVDANAPIDIATSLMWTGPRPMATIWGSGGGPVAFGLQQIDGDIALGPAMTGDCAPHEYARLVPVAIPFRKSGGFSGDDPNAAFYEAFFADPVLRLPAGRWRVTASLSGFLDVCDADAPGVDIALEATILVR